MSLCQPEKSANSCGACCGILNLALNRDELNRLLSERTREFNPISRDHASFYKYRSTREKKESNIPRINHEIYCCPFFGFLSSNNKTGCMIHPELTGDPESQNASFYGTSICRDYRCKNFTLNDQDKNLFIELATDWIEYSMMAGDYVFRESLEQKYKAVNEADRQSLIRQDYRDRFLSGKICPVTSFEIKN